MTDKPQKKDMRKVKCPYCEEQLPRGEAIRHTNGRYYHEDCYEEATAESRHYAELIDTACRIFGLKQPNGQILRQFKLYREDPELNYTNKGMELTLEYYYDLLGNKPRPGDGVGIIPLHYDRAKSQYIHQMKVNESAENFEEEEKRTVYISPSRERRSKRYESIDIESL